MSKCCSSCSSGSETSTDTSNRRKILLGAAKLLTFSVVTSLLYPLFKFIGYKVPQKKQFISIEKDLLPGGFHIADTFVLFVSEDGPWAVSRRCTHLGCMVVFNDTLKQLICPCHQSKFSTQGKRLSGPAVKDLSLFHVEKAPAGQKGYVVTV